MLTAPQLGATNGVSMSVCDAGVLGGLFRHLHTGAQVASFVRAFEGLRRERARAMHLHASLATIASTMATHRGRARASTFGVRRSGAPLQQRRR